MSIFAAKKLLNSAMMMKKYKQQLSIFAVFLHLYKKTMLFWMDRNPPTKASKAGPEGKWTVPPWKKQLNSLQIYKRNIWKSESFPNIEIRQRQAGSGHFILSHNEASPGTWYTLHHIAIMYAPYKWA